MGSMFDPDPRESVCLVLRRDKFELYRLSEKELGFLEDYTIDAHRQKLARAAACKYQDYVDGLDRMKTQGCNQDGPQSGEGSTSMGIVISRGVQQPTHADKNKNKNKKKKNTCQYPGYKYSTDRSLKQHQLVHTGPTISHSNLHTATGCIASRIIQPMLVLSTDPSGVWPGKGIIEDHERHGLEFLVYRHGSHATGAFGCGPLSGKADISGLLNSLVNSPCFYISATRRCTRWKKPGPIVAGVKTSGRRLPREIQRRMPPQRNEAETDPEIFLEYGPVQPRSPSWTPQV
ncbi:hypothetical protein LTS07_010576 [Exophiala sideris]|uniref:C2H2-type domain-containing protein n=1 Tax=Exophiala sideris TaxID=1016849 RepID=A0ABR0IXA1_9EURO|nr:hypothetical protein LTS07_010576 [Exophiala sideris]KAK5050265.1 hypothetical protein LTR69_010600 [Exophiala sideris]